MKIYRLNLCVKTMLLTLVCLLTSIHLRAENTLTVEVGSTEDLSRIPVYLIMTNDVEIQGFQASFALPEGLGEKKFNEDDDAADTYCVLGDRAGKNHIKNTVEMFTISNPNDLLVSVTPGTKNDMFAVGSDVVATFTFDGSSLTDGTYTLKMYKAFLITSGGTTRYNSPDCEVSFTIGNPKTPVTLSSMTKVGEMTFTHEYAVDESVKDKAADGYIQSYAKQTYEYDLNTILAAFKAAGCECVASDMEFAGVEDATTMTLDFFDKSTPGTTVNGHVSSSNCLYMMFDGTVCDYGTTCECKVGFDTSSYGYVQFAWTGGTGSDTTPADGDKCTASAYYVVDNKYYYELKFDITFRAPVENAQSQFIVNMNQYILPDYKTTSYNLPLSDICNALDVDTTTFVKDYMDWMANGGSDLITLETDEHSVNFTQGTRGNYWLSSDGKAVTWNTDNCVWCTAFIPDATTDVFEVRVCQMPNKSQIGDMYHAVMALSYNEKQVTFDITDNIVENPTLKISTKEKAGELTFQTNAFIQDLDNYSIDTVSVNVDSIAALMGTTGESLEFMALADEETFAVSTTATKGGYWLDENSYVCTWGDNALMSIEPTIANDYSNFTVGQYPSHITTPGTYSSKVYLTAGDKYVVLNFNLNVKSEQGKSYTVVTCETVGTKNYTYYIVPNDNYQDYAYMDTLINADLDWITSLVGSNPILYAERYTLNGTYIYSKDYSCDPNPGFWMEPDPSGNEHRSSAATWGSADTYGICYASGEFQFWQYPSSTAAVVGNYYTDNFYLVNLEEGKKIKFTFTVKYVSELNSYSLGIDPITAYADSTKQMYINLRNGDKFTSLQFDIKLPNGVSITKDSAGDPMIEAMDNSIDHNIIETTDLDDGYLRIVCGSSNNTTFNGTEGAILALNLTIDPNTEVGDQIINVKNIVLSTPSAVASKLEDFTSQMTIKKYTMGDVNQDGGINVADMTAVISQIMHYQEFPLYPADFNKNNIIEVGDLASIINLILAQPSNVIMRREIMKKFETYNNALAIEGFGISKSSEYTFAINLNSDVENLTGLQFDMTLPEGLSLVNIENGPKAVNHKIVYSKSEDGVIRCMNYSMQNEKFNDAEEKVILVTVKADDKATDGDIQLSNIIASTTNSEAVGLNDIKAYVTVGEATNIDYVNANSKTNGNVYDMNGRQKHGISKGFNIISGKKVYVK